MILVIDNYDSFTWNLVHYLEELGAPTTVYRNDRLSVDDALALRPDKILLSPGPCTPDEAGICIELAKAAPEDLPVLGVCLGHQAIGQAFGGKVSGAKSIKHGKVDRIEQKGGRLFEGLPSSFSVVRYHSLAVGAEQLPDCLTVNAATPDNEIMAFEHISRPVFGVQFHPESIATEYGHELLANFLKIE